MTHPVPVSPDDLESHTKQLKDALELLESYFAQLRTKSANNDSEAALRKVETCVNVQPSDKCMFFPAIPTSPWCLGADVCLMVMTMSCCYVHHSVI